MAIKIPESLKLQAIADTARFEKVDEFNLLRQHIEPELNRIVKEVMEPNQAVGTTLTELRDIYLSTLLFEEKLTSVQYDTERRGFLRDAIRLLDTSNHWLQEENRDGAYRARSVADVIAASRPWRARVSKIGAHAFVFDEDLAEKFADVNSTGTLNEEKADLEVLNSLIEKHASVLRKYGLTDGLVQEGLRLQNEAEGRDFFAILGLRDQEDAVRLRNRLLTCAVLLGKEARAAGSNALHDDKEGSGRFDASSFRNAMRRLRPKRKSAPEPEKAETT